MVLLVLVSLEVTTYMIINLYYHQYYSSRSALGWT